MRVSDKAIVLQTIKHGDKKLIVRLYTQKHGLLSAVAIAGKAPGSKVRPANLLPLSLISCQYTLKQNRDLHQLSECACYFVGEGYAQSIIKLSIAQFINEILIKCLREHTPNEALYALVETCIKYLQEADKDFVNLHVYFLLELSKYMGFEPQNNYSSARSYFDCREGTFVAQAMAFPIGLNKVDSEFFSRCLQSSVLRSPLTLSERKLLLDILLAYYRLHLPGFGDMKSLEVLQQVLAQR